MFILARALVYATLFIGFLLVFLPARIVAWSGIASPQSIGLPQIIGAATPILIDGGCKVEGYESDITRTFVLGKAMDKQKRVFDIVQRAQQAALDVARPGVSCQAVDAAARKVISEAGFGPDYRFFTHRVGHGIGRNRTRSARRPRSMSRARTPAL